MITFHDMDFTVRATRRADAERRAKVAARNYFGGGVRYRMTLHARPAVVAHDGTVPSWEVFVTATVQAPPDEPEQ